MAIPEQNCRLVLNLSIAKKQENSLQEVRQADQPAERGAEQYKDHKDVLLGAALQADHRGHPKVSPTQPSP